MTEREIFVAALQIEDADGRHDYLTDACGADPALRQRVEGLLGALGRAGDFLQRPAADGMLPSATLSVRGEAPGDQIGPYKLLEQIGEGGMGLVFMAEQSQPVRRRVALKVLKPGLDTRHVMARFEAERQALALMDHPHIAHVFDAGATDGGRPYFVMELVRGVAITDFCDQHRLDTRRRLELFVQVCRAVQHAHQKGVIHRDLKPGNVLVTLHDTVAVPKIIDFGIAKATGPALTERTLFTHFAQMVGTPLYMSPEQAEMNGLDVDTRSDVYALGVLLYELLTGATPFEGAALGLAGLDEVRRIIREAEPPAPSRRLSTLAAERQSTVSERRGVDGRRLSQLLRGELDWVVMRALEKDRSRRYESASALAADVERYLADEPVEAGPPSALYRMRKFARRNRRSLVAAGVVAAALVAATAVSTWQAVKARDAERRAAAEADIAKEVNHFLQYDLLFLASTEYQKRDGITPDKDLPAKALLDRAALKIGERFQERPLVEAAIRMTIGDAYLGLGETKTAILHFERAITARRANLYGDHPDVLLSEQLLASAYREDGQGDRAVAAFAAILEKVKAKYGLNHVETIDCMHHLALAYDVAGRSGESIALLTKVLELSRIVLGSDKRLTNAAANSLGVAYQKVGRFDEADPLLRARVERERPRSGHLGERLGAANAMDYLGLNLLMQGKYGEAEPLLRDALVIYEADFPDYWRRFSIMNMLGEALVGQKDYAVAEPLLLHGYQGMKEREATIYANWKPRLAQAIERIARFYEATNQPEKAREWRAKLSAGKAP